MYVVRGPVSAGLRTRTPGVGENTRACAAVAVATRRSIMVLREGSTLARRFAAAGVLPFLEVSGGGARARRSSCVELRRWGFGGDGSPFSHQKLGFRLGERPLASKIGAIRPEV